MSTEQGKTGEGTTPEPSAGTTGGGAGPKSPPSAPPTSPLKPPRRPALARNALSLVGIGLALVSVANILLLAVLGLVFADQNPYIGIFAYMILPGFLALGIGLFIAGVVVERRRQRQAAPTEIPPFPRIDLNDPRQRRAFLIAGLSTAAFIVLSTFGSYNAYQYTDSVKFCGLTCHTPMHPEYTAYLASPHARVPCADCHVGPGASWYVRSKLSGAYQVYATLFDKYPRPIPTPIKSLRPAQETCEQCHWPKKFYGGQLKTFTSFASDDANTPTQIRMIIKTGGGNPATGEAAGIHWHMNIGNQITFVAKDKQLQDIPWIQVKDKLGRVTVYKAADSKLTDKQIDALPHHRMDCIDCHDRPSHIFNPPSEAVDVALLANRIDRKLPDIKMEAVQVLTQKYKTTPQAVDAIATGVDKYYRTQQPKAYAADKAKIDQAIAEIQRIYQTNIFPEMNVDWTTHPNNLGHFYSKGCFRCHDGQHKTADGRVISNACTVCHTILGETTDGQTPIVDADVTTTATPGGKSGQPGPAAAGAQPGTTTAEAKPATSHGVPSVDFQHPVDIGPLSGVQCSDCHTGGQSP